MSSTLSAKNEYDRIRFHLESYWGTNEADAIAFMLLEHFYQLKRNNILTNEKFDLKKDVEKKLLHALTRLEKMEPIQYVLGSTIFSGLRFRLNEHVLIPRPETEELVDLIVKINKVNNPRIIDIGTGSGCIAISLAKRIPDANITATDIDENALILTRENAEFNEVDLTLFQSDILSESIPGSEFDIVVSNPPYVRYSEQDLMDENVLKYEPDIALYVPDDNPLVFYYVIARKAKTKLKSRGFLYFEINEAFGSEICKLLSEEGYWHINLFNDINDKPRIVQAMNH